MKYSQACINTFRDFPKDAEVPSHKWLSRAGMLVKHASGVYSYAPLLQRIIRKVTRIVEEEMEKVGAHQVTFPILQPAQLWEESGRLPAYQQEKIIFQLQDRHGGKFCLAPTAEEAAVEFIKRMVQSPKQVPVTVYQIQSKFRDEFRPRFGLLRGKEFLMKDGYSFDLDEEGLGVNYEKMRQAYYRIFDRCQVKYIAVQADSGAMGGNASEEFMAISETGEDTLLYCEGYAANVEKAVAKISDPDVSEELKLMEKKQTPQIKTIGQLCDFLQVEANQIVKTILYRVTYEEREETVAILIRGDLDVNEIKLLNHLEGALEVSLANETIVHEMTQAEIGFAGPLGMDQRVKIFADQSVKNLRNFICGGCETDSHLINVNLGRDFAEPEFHDFLLAKAGQQSINGKILEEVRGIELGHIFKLGQKYSQKMGGGLTIDNQFQAFWMGCYGIGISRLISAVLEQSYDGRGLVWNTTLAPYQVHLVPIRYDKEEIKAVADQVEKDLQEKGIEVLMDDRKVTTGVKFADADMLGMPFHVILGKGALEEEGVAEIKVRKTGEVLKCPLFELVGILQKKIQERETKE